jgi:two-component system alkaline phosphatase synthesis response regulator PhoP
MPKKKILVIEDDRDISELITYNLEREGYEIACLYDGSQAVDFVRKRRPELIILDLMLPEVDGLEICRTLKSDAATKQIPIVMLTAKSEEADVVVGLQMGADDYIPKPFSPKVLVARIKAITRRMADLCSNLSSKVKMYAASVILISTY